MLGLYGFCGCKGLQPSKSITAIEVSLGSGGRPVFIGFHGCEGPQPAKSITPCKALIGTLEGVRSLGYFFSSVKTRLSSMRLMMT